MLKKNKKRKKQNIKSACLSFFYFPGNEPTKQKITFFWIWILFRLKHPFFFFIINSRSEKNYSQVISNLLSVSWSILSLILKVALNKTEKRVFKLNPFSPPLALSDAWTYFPLIFNKWQIKCSWFVSQFSESFRQITTRSF